MAPDQAAVKPVSISDSLTINLTTPISVDIGGVTGTFPAVKITSLNVQEQGVYLGTNPPAAVNASSVAAGGNYIPFSAMSDTTVAAAKAFVAAIGADWAAGITKA